MGEFDDLIPKDRKGGGTFTDLVPKQRPSVFRADSDFRKRAGLGHTDMLVAAAKDMFGGDPAAYLAEQYNEGNGGGAQVVRGSDGEAMLRLPSGEQYAMNDKGVDSQDIGNVAGNVAAFFLPASWASRVGQAKNVGLAGRAGLQALAAGGTDIGLQAATKGGDVDLGRSAAVAGSGAGGELLGAGLAASGKAAAAKVAPQVKDIYLAAKARGINLTPAQLSDSAFIGYLRKQLGALPGSGAASQ